MPKPLHDTRVVGPEGHPHGVDPLPDDLGQHIARTDRFGLQLSIVCLAPVDMIAPVQTDAHALRMEGLDVLLRKIARMAQSPRQYEEIAAQATVAQGRGRNVQVRTIAIVEGDPDQVTAGRVGLCPVQRVEKLVAGDLIPGLVIPGLVRPNPFMGYANAMEIQDAYGPTHGRTLPSPKARARSSGAILSRTAAGGGRPFSPRAAAIASSLAPRARSLATRAIDSTHVVGIAIGRNRHTNHIRLR